MVPHLAHGVAGPLHRQLLPTAAIVGAVLLAVSDMLCRFLLTPQELPVGIVTASIGSAFVFLSLSRTPKLQGQRRRERGYNQASILSFKSSRFGRRPKRRCTQNSPPSRPGVAAAHLPGDSGRGS
ncbi:MAG: iron chelate uptake ABC transporter family permease subunit [Boseongicola sp.]|nr:iron chelate uptake ABC transporter family permease subunit [Boseongicola sp.]